MTNLRMVMGCTVRWFETGVRGVANRMRRGASVSPQAQIACIKSRGKAEGNRRAGQDGAGHHCHPRHFPRTQATVSSSVLLRDSAMGASTDGLSITKHLSTVKEPINRLGQGSTSQQCCSWWTTGFVCWNVVDALLLIHGLFGSSIQTR